MDTKTLINKLIKIIENVPAPNQIIIKGPRATLGREFNMVKYGSVTLARFGNHHNMAAIKISHKVIIIWEYNSPSMTNPWIVTSILEGLENKNELINPFEEQNCHSNKKTTIIKNWKKLKSLIIKW